MNTIYASTDFQMVRFVAMVAFGLMAYRYYVDGARGEAKRIALNRSLVVWELVVSAKVSDRLQP